MGLRLRITYKNTDVVFELLTEKPSFATTKIEISLNGGRYHLTRREKQWFPESDDKALDNELAQAIGKAIELRYRL